MIERKCGLRTFISKSVTINNELGINLFKTQPEIRHVEQKNQMAKQYANGMKAKYKKFEQNITNWYYPLYKLNSIGTGMSVFSLAWWQKCQTSTHFRYTV